jgi:hypothetical protein
LHDGESGVVLSSDFSPTFREIVAWCLSRRPYDRPEVAELEAWVRGEHTGRAPAAALQPVEIALPEPAIPQPIAAQSAAPIPVVSDTAAPKAAAPEAAKSESAIKGAQRPAIRAVVNQGTSAQQPSKRRVLALTLAAVVVLALSWAGVRMLRSSQASTPTAAEAVREAGSQTPGPLQTPSEAARVVSAEAETSASPPGVQEVIPDVPRRARHTIRGHVRVSVRLIVDKEGTVFAALVDKHGPSRYFARLAIEAAKKWTFAPVDTQAQRLMLVRFEFTREGTTARAVAL